MKISSSLYHESSNWSPYLTYKVGCRKFCRCCFRHVEVSWSSGMDPGPFDCPFSSFHFFLALLLMMQFKLDRPLHCVSLAYWFNISFYLSYCSFWVKYLSYCYSFIPFYFPPNCSLNPLTEVQYCSSTVAGASRSQTHGVGWRR